MEPAGHTAVSAPPGMRSLGADAGTVSYRYIFSLPVNSE
jgi:hypothetical protein